MTRYFFDIQDKGGFHRDPVGDEFDDFDEARAQCQALVAEIVREELPDGAQLSVVCELRDESGAKLYRAELTFQGLLLRP